MALRRPHRRKTAFALPSPAFSAAIAAALLLAGCAATQAGTAVEPQAPGFWFGLWHGFIFPVAWILSLFMPDVALYAVPNNGGWYDFGYFLGIVVFGTGARRSVVEIRRDRRTQFHTTSIHHHHGPVIDGTAARDEERR